VVTRGHSWSLVVIRGHSCVLLDKISYVYVDESYITIYTFKKLINKENTKKNHKRVVCAIEILLLLLCMYDGREGTSEFPTFRVSEIPSFRVSEFPRFRDSEIPSFRVSEIGRFSAGFGVLEIVTF
jgi:hypothetical protein